MQRLGLSAVKLFSKNSNLYDYDTSTSLTDRRTDGQLALAIPRYAFRAVKTVMAVIPVTVKSTEDKATPTRNGRFTLRMLQSAYALMQPVYTVHRTFHPGIDAV